MLQRLDFLRLRVRLVHSISRVQDDYLLEFHSSVTASITLSNRRRSAMPMVIIVNGRSETGTQMGSDLAPSRVSVNGTAAVR